MNEEELNELYEKVLRLVNKNPTPYNETNLIDWLLEGDTENMTVEEIAVEWDEANKSAMNLTK